MGCEELDYEKYELECAKRVKENNQFINLFRQELERSGLSDKTIHRHCANVDFFLNVYNLREEADSIHDAWKKLNDYFGYFYIRKCMWSTPANIKSTAGSIKKFYKCMLEHAIVQKQDYDEIVRMIKEQMQEWMDDCEQFNDPEQSNPFF